MGRAAGLRHNHTTFSGLEVFKKRWSASISCRIGPTGVTHMGESGGQEKRQEAQKQEPSDGLSNLPSVSRSLVSQMTAQC